MPAAGRHYCARCWWVAARARPLTEQLDREVAMFDDRVEQARQALEDEHRRQWLEHDPADNVADFWRGR